MNNLALSDYVDLDDKQARNKNFIKMIIVFIILIAVYQLTPSITYVLNGPIDVAIYLIVAGVIAYVAHYFGRTTKVVNQRVKLGKATLVVYIIFMILWALILIPEKVKVFETTPNLCANVLLLATFSGIIEEALFRGLILNAFIDLFSKSKHIFIWSALAESLCFGCAHLLNLDHQSLLSTIGQVFIVTGLGLLLSYMRFATNGILLGTIFHIYFDISPQLEGTNYGNSDVKGAFIFFLILIIVAIPCIYSYNKRYNEGIIKE